MSTTPSGDPSPVDVAVIAERAYNAYGDVTGRRNYQGNPMPNWADLGQTIQDAWCAAVRCVLNSPVAGSDPAD